ncbi:unnamed protein product [Amoebophrya sp. A120]|nr:unnamed protein product [Amoebophrya sp. A120]|eukprot:GSA120T00007295001.1
MPVEGAKFPDGEWSYAMGSIRKALGINADDLIEDRYAAAARKKHRPPDKTKLDKYLEHLRTQAEEAIGDEVKKMDEDEKDDPGRKLDHQRKLVKLIFAWRNLNGPKGWEGFPEIDKSKLIQISVSAVTALVEHAQASDEMARPRRFVPRAFSFLCRYYGLLGGEFRDALKSAWVAPLPEQNRLPAQVFKDLVYLVERELTHTHHTMRAVVQGSRNVTLRTVKFNQAIAASHLQDLEAMASKVEAGGPVRFFDSFGELKTETRVGWPQKALDDFADQFYRRGRGSKIVLVEGKSKFRQLVLAKLKSDLATTVKNIKTAEGRLKDEPLTSCSPCEGWTPITADFFPYCFFDSKSHISQNRGGAVYPWRRRPEESRTSTF